MKVFLDHAQMEPQQLQIDLERATNLEQTHFGLNFGDSCLILDESGLVCAAIEFAFEFSQSAVQLRDSTDVQPSVKARSEEADEGNQDRDDRNDKEHKSVE